jgi:hypothetical protein
VRILQPISRSTGSYRPRVAQEITQAFLLRDGAVRIEGGNGLIALHRLVSVNQRRSQPKLIGRKEFAIQPDRETCHGRGRYMPERCDQPVSHAGHRGSTEHVQGDLHKGMTFHSALVEALYVTHGPWNNPACSIV